MTCFENYRASIRTDLASERRRADLSLPGVTYEEERRGCVTVERLRVESDEGAAQIGKPRGNYMTFTFPELFEAGDDYTEAVTAAAEALASLLPPRRKKPILIAGLGNAGMTPDAVGPETSKRVLASAQWRQDGICVLSPAVAGQSGMEASRVIAAVAKEMEVCAVIAVDALCARSSSRLMRTLQFADTGITPGSGIREARNALNRETVGVPVIAIGVPTLISTAAMVCEALERAGAEEVPEAFYHLLNEQTLYVCPKDIDIGVTRAAEIIADIINRL